MKTSLLKQTTFLITFICCALLTKAQHNFSGIHLKKTTDYTQLVIDEKPFLILGGELGNSSASNINYLKSYWNHLKNLNLNTLLVPIYWELLEPTENNYDFTLVDEIIKDATQHNIKLVFLWFGTWKNSMSCYAPQWMKTNAKRFPRTYDTSSRSQELFSVFSKETLEADKKAFANLMKHIKNVDAAKTVIMMQVENEIGMLPTSREFSKTANKQFNDVVPKELTSYLFKNKNNLVPEFNSIWQKQGYKTNDTWKNTFGESLATDEIFQAWYYAKFANEVAAAGKKEYDIPMFVNAALPRPGKLPGQYPSAGPLPHLMDVWQAAAPAIDMLSPDFYNPNTKDWCNLYVRNNNRLFIPEINFDNTVPAKSFFIIGHYKAIGFSPFSIENENKNSVALSKSYDLLQQLAPIIANKNWLNMDGYLLDKKEKTSSSIMGNYKLSISHYNTMSWASEAKDSVWTTTGGIVLQTALDEFLVAGSGIVVVFENSNSNFVTNIASADEVTYIANVEQKGRRMNGDEDHQGRHIRFPTGEWGIQKVKLYYSPTKISE